MYHLALDQIIIGNNFKQAFILDIYKSVLYKFCSHLAALFNFGSLLFPSAPVLPLKLLFFPTIFALLLVSEPFFPPFLTASLSTKCFFSYLTQSKCVLQHPPMMIGAPCFVQLTASLAKLSGVPILPSSSIHLVANAS